MIEKLKDVIPILFKMKIRPSFPKMRNGGTHLHVKHVRLIHNQHFDTAEEIEIVLEKGSNA